MAASYSTCIAQMSFASTRIDASANFTPAAYIMIQHEAFFIPKKAVKAAMTSDYQYKRQTYISVHGVQGESVMVSCDIQSFDLQDHYIDGSNTNTHGCDGNAPDQPQEVVSGQRVSKKVTLSNSMLPNSLDKDIKKTISINISYI